MATAHLIRVILVVPSARVAAFNTWARNNLDVPTAGDWFTLRLSATGSAPYSHAWCCAALTLPQFKLVMQQLCSLAGITPPANWDTMTRAEKKSWLISQRPTIRTNTGVWVAPWDNDGVWDDSRDSLQAMGLVAGTT